MRFANLLPAVLAPMVFCSVACASKAYDEGAAQANADLKAGYAFVYTFGLRIANDHYNDETGLPYAAIAGCIVDDSILDRAKGYNETVRAWIASNGKVPANSLKPYAEELKDLDAFWMKSSVNATAIGAEPIRVFGDADQEHTVRMNEPDQNGFTTITLMTDAGERAQFLSSTKDQTAHFKPGPAGSQTIVVRMPTGGDTFTYQVFELRRGAAMQWQKKEPVASK